MWRKLRVSVKPPTISSNLVQPLTNEDLSQRLQTINQEVLSRSSLEPMVQKYDLYKIERAQGMPMELVIEKMYKAIKKHRSVRKIYTETLLRKGDIDPKEAKQ